MSRRLSRQKEILAYVFIGKTNGEIAQLLGLSPLTIKNHLLKIYRALGAYNRQNAVYNAIRRGEIEVPGYIREGDVCPLKRAELAPRHEDMTWLRWKNLELCPQTWSVRCADATVCLSRSAFKVLMFFLEHPLSVHTRPFILDNVWGRDKSVDERVVDVYVRRVRATLGAIGHGDLIETVHGIGYRTKQPRLEAVAA